MQETGAWTCLRFQIRQYQVGKPHSGKRENGKPLGFKTLIKPAPEAQKRHKPQLKQPIRTLRGASQEGLITRLNPLIRGWTFYYRSVVASQCFNRMAWEMGHMRLPMGDVETPKQDGGMDQQAVLETEGNLRGKSSEPHGIPGRRGNSVHPYPNQNPTTHQSRGNGFTV
jgi:Group II intron, maturase-specific domain